MLIDEFPSYRLYSGDDFSERILGEPLCAVLKDGTVIEAEGLIDGGGMAFTIYGQQYSYSSLLYPHGSSLYLSQFGDYTYSGTVNLLGQKYEVDIPVKVVGETYDGGTYGIASVDIPDISVFAADAFSLFFVYPDATITLNSGEKILVESVNSNSFDEGYWKVGESYKYDVSICGINVEYTISIIENPVIGLTEDLIISTDPYIDKVLRTENGTVRYVTYYVPQSHSFSFLLNDGSIVDGDEYGFNIYNNMANVHISDNNGQMTEKDKIYSSYISVGGKRFDYKVIFTDAVPGDVDGDNVVNESDVEYLLYHIFYPQQYPARQDCDFDGDGVVGDKDAEYLLYHVFFPDDYPLKNIDTN